MASSTEFTTAISSSPIILHAILSVPYGDPTYVGIRCDVEDVETVVPAWGNQILRPHVSPLSWLAPAAPAWLHRGGRSSEFADGTCPTTRDRVTVAAWHEAARFDWNKSQRAHGRADPARIAGGLRQADQIEQGECAYALHATNCGLYRRPKWVGAARSQFSLRSMQFVDPGHGNVPC